MTVFLSAKQALQQQYNKKLQDLELDGHLYLYCDGEITIDGMFTSLQLSEVIEIYKEYYAALTILNCEELKRIK